MTPDVETEVFTDELSNEALRSGLARAELQPLHIARKPVSPPDKTVSQSGVTKSSLRDLLARADLANDEAQRLRLGLAWLIQNRGV